MEEKTLARTEALFRRDSIPANQRAERSAVLCQRLAEELLPALPPCGTIATYSAMKSEIDLSAFCAEAVRRGFRIAYPCMVRADSPIARTPDDASPSLDGSAVTSMRFFLLDPSNPAPDFLKHPARAFCPTDPLLSGCILVSPRDLDAVLVPLVAFDAESNRLGYGGGNYDRLLEKLRPDAYVAGVAFEEQRVERVPLEPHDRSLPRIFVG